MESVSVSDDKDFKLHPQSRIFIGVIIKIPDECPVFLHGSTPGIKGRVAALLRSNMNGLIFFLDDNRTNNRNNVPSPKTITATN